MCPHSPSTKGQKFLLKNKYLPQWLIQFIYVHMCKDWACVLEVKQIMIYLQGAQQQDNGEECCGHDIWNPYIFLFVVNQGLAMWNVWIESMQI